MRLDTGRLRQRVRFETPTKIDVAGETRRTWEEVFTVWAEAIPVSSKDVAFAASLGVEAEWRITIRYREDVTNEMRIVHGDRVLQIIGTPRDIQSDHVAIEMFAKEVDS